MLTEAERHTAVSRLEQSWALLVDATGGLTDADWRRRPGPSAWSALDIVEHLALVEHSVAVLLAERLPARPPAPPDRRSTVADDEVIRIIEDRRHRVIAPDRARPKRDPSVTPAVALEALSTKHGWFIQYARETLDDLRARLAPHPAVGLLDAYQWLLFVAAHMNRHVSQLVETTSR